MDEKMLPAGFEQIWARVTDVSDTQETPLTPVQELERFMDGEAGSIAAYRALAASCRGRDRQTVFRILSDERRHMSLLQLEYFMRQGDSYLPAAPSAPPEGNVLTALREAFLAETGAAGAYGTAAERRGGELGALYAAIGEDEARHARLLKEMAARCFTERA